MGDLSYAQQAQIERLQDNLSALRRIAGWTMEQLGVKIGVTKQTISTLESSKSCMTLTQYLAIRSVLDYEAADRIQENQNDTLLALAIKKVLDDELDEEEMKTAEGDVALIAAAVAGKAPDDTVVELANKKLGSEKANKLAVALAATILGLNIAPGFPGLIASPLILGTGMFGWMRKLLSDDHTRVMQKQNESNQKNEITKQ